MYIGQAGWSVYKGYDAQFPGEGTHLERYGRVLNAVEINTSFYRPHQPKTYARWAASVPADFRFAVKAPQDITHLHRLKDVEPLLDAFLAETSALGEKRGPLLFQLPPSLAFDAGVARTFFDDLRARYAGPAVLEPRHRSWFADEVETLLEAHQVARVAADPARAPGAERPGGFPGLVYYRWHGSPRMYYSAYGRDELWDLAERVRGKPNAWVLFDNTAAFAATGNALELQALVL